MAASNRFATKTGVMEGMWRFRRGCLDQLQAWLGCKARAPLPIPVRGENWWPVGIHRRDVR